MNRLDLALGNGNRPYQYKVSITVPTIIIGTAPTSTVSSTLLSGLTNTLGLTNTGNLNVDQSTIDALCNKASVPSLSTEQVSMFVHGREVKVPFGTVSTHESTVSFYLDDSYYMRHLLEFWMLSRDCYYEFANKDFIDNDIKPTQGLMGAITSTVKSLFSSLVQSLTTPASASSAAPTSAWYDSYYDKLKRVRNPAELYGSVSISPLDYQMTEICTYTLHNVYPVTIGDVHYANNSTGAISEFDTTFYYTHFTVSTASIVDKITGNLLKTIGLG